MIKSIRNKKGFTLIEVVASSLLLTILISFGLNYMIIWMNINKNLESRLEENYHLTRAMQFLTDEVRAAHGIISPGAGQQSDQMRLEGENVWDRKNYRVWRNQLWVEKNNGHNPIADGIGSVEFHVTSDRKTVIIVIESTEENGRKMQTAVSLRR
ncbi:prepilin-type N-terminal cleavage/methylation domain-containing protein [Desulfitispora alkaliphila]|uniref:PulJ/GspJ family protein n=1 Tax=Desulfitispora alkaliphila TaxID=622674 RepID=UPI003D1BA0BC